MVLVLAANKEEFNKFLEKHEPKNIFRFVNEEADYAGHKDCDLVLVPADSGKLMDQKKVGAKRGSVGIKGFKLRISL